MSMEAPAPTTPKARPAAQSPTHPARLASRFLPRLALAATLVAAFLGLSAPATAQSIAASNIGNNSVTITLTRAGYTGNWQYSVSGGTVINCRGDISGDSVTITELTQGASHTVTVWATCSGPPSSRHINDKNLEVDFRTTSGPSLSVDETSNAAHNSYNTKTATSLTLNLTSHSGAWWYKYTTPAGGSCSSQVAAGTTTATATGLAPDTSYTFKAYDDNACSTELATAAASATLRAQVANMTVSPLNGDKANLGLYVEWTGQSDAEAYEIQWKSSTDSDYNDGDRQTRADTSGGQGSLNSTLNTWVTLPGAGKADMANGTEYTVRVRSLATVGASDYGEWSDEVSGTPAAESLTASNISSSGATLTLGSYRGQGDWHYLKAARGAKDGTSLGELGAECEGPVSGETVRLTGLAPGTNYAATAFSNDSCTLSLGDLIEFTTLVEPPGPVIETPEISRVTPTSATLSIGDYQGPWWYRGSQRGAACIAVPAGTTTVRLAGLKPGTKYTYRIWNSAGCTEGFEIESTTFTTESPPDRHPTAAIGVDVRCEDGLCRATTGTPVRFLDTSTGTVRYRLWDFHGASTSRSSSVFHAFESPGFHDVSLTVSLDGERESTASLKFLVEASRPAGTCQATATTLCLRDSRYELSLRWWTADGPSGDAPVVREGTNDSGLFRFFDEDNWEMLVKVLDGCSLNGRHWVYAASATNLGYELNVRDTVTDVVKEYRNEPGMPSPAVADGDAFAAACEPSAASSLAEAWAAALPPSSAAAPATPAAGDSPGANPGHAAPATEDGGCTETATTLCLLNGRYEVSVAWSRGAANGSQPAEGGPGRTVRARTDDSGLFWFFTGDNWEMLVKVLDGCAYNGHHWVYAASATTVGLELTVRDAENGESKTWFKEAGEPAPAIVDAGAFGGRCATETALAADR